MIADKLEQAENIPVDDYHLKYDIERVLRWIKSGHLESIDEELDALDPGHPIYKLVEAMHVWERSDGNDFENGMGAALQALDELFELARTGEWDSVASFALLKSIEYREGLGGYTPGDRFRDILGFLKENFLAEADVSLGELTMLVEKMLDHHRDLKEEQLEKLLELVEDRAQRLRDDTRYMQERNFIGYQISIRELLDKDLTKQQARMIESFEDEFEQRSSASSLLKADVLERAVATCQAYLPDEKENRWRMQIREFNREAAEEMPVIEHEVDLGDDIDAIVEGFESASAKTSSWEALSMLLYAPVGYGSYEKAVERMGKTPLANSLPRSVMSPEGDTIGREPGMTQDGERVPASYIPEIQASNHALVVALHRLMENNQVTEADWYTLLSIVPGVSVDDQAFLTDAIINLYRGRYPESVHLAVPRLESVTAGAYVEMGNAVTKNQGQIYEQRGLGGLFRLIVDDVDTDFGKYLEYRYTNTAGSNVRNRVAHGQLRYSVADFKLAATVLFDIFRTAARIEEGYATTP